VGQGPQMCPKRQLILAVDVHRWLDSSPSMVAREIPTSYEPPATLPPLIRNEENTAMMTVRLGSCDSGGEAGGQEELQCL
jgi:hypothetical protein